MKAEILWDWGVLCHPHVTMVSETKNAPLQNLTLIILHIILKFYIERGYRVVRR